jgi:hypothetical protein
MGSLNFFSQFQTFLWLVDLIMVTIKYPLGVDIIKNITDYIYREWLKGITALHSLLGFKFRPRKKGGRVAL